MATNLTTIQVQLQANARNFKQNIDTAGKSLNKLKKSTTAVTDKQAKFQKFGSTRSFRSSSW
jgi:hypothetical protein